jgi:hypothetical protein
MSLFTAICDNGRVMAEPFKPPAPLLSIPSSRETEHPVSRTSSTQDASAPELCERCGAAMYRMHAVWRCPSCGFKTDCCGW